MIRPEEINDEIKRAVQKFPQWPSDPHHALNIITEELGELARAVLQLTYEPGKATRSDARKEAIQLAVTALRFATSFDQYEYAPAKQHAQLAVLSVAVPFSVPPPSATIGDATKTQPCASNARDSLLQESQAAKKQRNLDRSNAVRRVFRHWRDVMNKPTAKLTPDRIKIISRALFKWEYPEAQIVQAINGCAMTPHNMGIRPDGSPGPTYNDLELILRDAAHIERFIETASQPERMNRAITNTAAQQIAAIFDDAGTLESNTTLHLENESSQHGSLLIE